MAESSTPEEMLSSDESSGELRADIPDHNLILYVTEARVLRVEFTNCQSWPHETSWACTPTPNLSLNKEFCPQLGELKEKWESCGEHLTSIHSGSLIFVFGHDTEFKAIQMLARHSEIKKAILLFLHKIDSQVEDISMEAVVQKAKRTALGTERRRHKESGQIITGMDGDSTAIHSNVSGTQNVQEMHQELGNIHISGGVFYVNCEGGTHETSWHCNPAPNKHLSQVPRKSFHRFGRRIREFFRARLRRVTRGSLIFSFAHTTSEDAIDMIVKHRKVKEIFLDFMQELDPSIEDIRIEVVLRELSVSEEQTTQITETRPGEMADPEHKDEEGAPRSHPQQKDDDETSHPHIQESGDNRSSLSHSLQKKDEDTCLPHPQKTEEDKTSPQQTDEDTSHLHPQQVYVKDKFKHQSIGIEKASSDPSLKSLVKGQDSDQHASSDPSQGQSWSERDPRLPAASHATPSRADHDLHYASWVGDLEKVKRLLSTPGVDINSRVGSLTPVMEAAQYRHRDVVELLVKEGAHVSLVDGDGNNTLHFACQGGDLETVEYVLSLHVVDINSRGWRSMTPVMAAAVWGHRDVMELLVKEGADVSLVDGVGNNTLHLACRGGDVETVQYVLSLHVVDIDARNKSGQTAADVARLWGHQPLVELLKSRGAQ